MDRNRGHSKMEILSQRIEELAKEKQKFQNMVECSVQGIMIHRNFRLSFASPATRSGNRNWFRNRTVHFEWRLGMDRNRGHSKMEILSQRIEELAKEKQKFQNMVECSVQGIMIHRNFRLLFVNQSLAENFGYDSPREMQAMGDVTRIIAPEELPRLQKLHEARLRGESPPISLRIYRRAQGRDPHPDGAQFPPGRLGR